MSPLCADAVPYIANYHAMDALLSLQMEHVCWHPQAGVALQQGVQALRCCFDGIEQTYFAYGGPQLSPGFGDEFHTTPSALYSLCSPVIVYGMDRTVLQFEAVAGYVLQISHPQAQHTLFEIGPNDAERGGGGVREREITAETRAHANDIPKTLHEGGNEETSTSLKPANFVIDSIPLTASFCNSICHAFELCDPRTARELASDARARDGFRQPPISTKTQARGASSDLVFESATDIPDWADEF